MAVRLPELYRPLGMDEDEIRSAEWRAGIAQKEIDAGFPTLHAHSLLGLWGALECLVEDIFRESIKALPELLSGETLSKIKLPVSVLYGPEEDRANLLLFELSRNLGADKRLGVGQFEVILDPVRLGGGVPPKIREAILHAQQIRHIWAHRGGTADGQFVERRPGRARVGERVDMKADEFLPIMHGLHMYALVILNRHMKNLGRAAVAAHCPGYEGVLTDDVAEVQPA
ncbi:hypothetical protein BHQ19_16855 [Mycolicibacterium porcinum]|nr:hypothetical protein BHQ19_16855 [Mycolicibacterium porcinum]